MLPYVPLTADEKSRFMRSDQTIAGIVVTLGKALQPEFREYAVRILKNSRTLAETLMKSGVKLITNGTDNHMMVIDTVSGNILFKISCAGDYLIILRGGLKQLVPQRTY